MKRTLSRRIALAALIFPIAALADINQTTTLQANTRLNLDTGATVASGGDILWNGLTITPQGSAKAFNVGAFGGLDGPMLKTFFDSFKIVATAATIPAATLVVGDTFALFTNGGNTAGVEVTAKSGTSITLHFITFIAAAATGPTITAILNNSSQIAPGLPNYGIAPSSLFVVKGSGLSDPGAPVLQPSDVGLPLLLNGASITVVVNGVTTRPALWYTSPAQLAAVLPANTPIGTGTLTVTYKGVTSAPAAIRVVASAVGINTYGVNTGVATDAVTGAVLTFTNSGTPGENIVLWATGLGADPADSDTTFTATPHAVNTPLQIYFGGILVKILYQGSSGYPGVNQINVTIPDSIPNGCWIPLVAVTGNVVSNTVTFPINKGGGVCFDSVSGLPGDQVSPTGGRTLKTGLVGLIQTDKQAANGTHTVASSADAAFEKYTGIYTPGNSVSPGGCIVVDFTPVPIGTITGLDVGVITLTGPSGLAVTLGPQLGIKGAFFANLPVGAIPKTGGTFTFKGSGGADVGSFTSTLELANPTLTWTNPTAAASIDRSQDLTLTWTGGNPGTYVAISGDSTFVSGSGSTLTQVIGGFQCLAPVEAGRFTVPSYILLALPAGNGGTLIQNIVNSALTPTGIDIGVASGDISYSIAGAYK